MKIKKHLPILSNFSNIGKSIIFKTGQLKVKDIDGSILAFYNWNENIGDDIIGIYNLKEFLQILSLFNDPEITFIKSSSDTDCYAINIKDDKGESDYISSKPIYCIYENITNISENYSEQNKKIQDFLNKEFDKSKFDNIDFSCNINSDILNQLRKANNVISAKHLVFSPNSTGIDIKSTDIDNSSSNVYKISIGTDIKNFNEDIVIYTDFFNFIEGNYNVTSYIGKIIVFEEKEKGLTYIIGHKKK